MKILIVRMYADCLNIKNYNCQEVGLAKALVKKGNICDIVLYTDKEPYEEDILLDNDNKKIHIYYLNAKNILKNAIFNSKLYEIANKYDVIQTAEYDQIGNVKLKRKINDKMVIYHGPYACEYTKGYNKKCMISDLYYKFHKNYKNTPCIAKSSLANKLLKTKGFKDVTTVGVGLDIERFKSDVALNNNIKELVDLKQKNNSQYMLYIGKIEDRRNITFLIEILENVVRKNKNVRLILVGKGDKQYVNKCFEYAKMKEVYENIIYIESIPQQELPNLYKNCEVFLLPTQYEIFGMVLLEAMYFGIPTVTTLNGGSSTIIKKQENGIICSLNNLDEWINAVNKILDDDIFRKEISKNSRKQIEENYTWDSLADKFINVYKKVIK